MRTLAQKVTESLRDGILHGQLRPGERLEEVPLAQRLGVSRTPVRAALAMLASDGLIDHQPKRGYVVRIFDLEAIGAAYEVRSVLEGLACRRAAQRGLTQTQSDRLLKCLAEGDCILAHGLLLPQDHEPYQRVNVEIHDTLLEASGNPWVSRFAIQAHNIPFASDRIILWDQHAVILHSHTDHHRIIDAVITRDSARAEQLMREHVYYAGLILKANYESLLTAGDAAPGVFPSPKLAGEAPAG